MLTYIEHGKGKVVYFPGREKEGKKRCAFCVFYHMCGLWLKVL